MLYVVKCLGGNQGSQDQLNGTQHAIAYSLCFGLNIDIADVLFSDLFLQLHPEGGKSSDTKVNICYTRYIYLIIEHLLQDKYHQPSAKSMKPNLITSAMFKPTWSSKTPLTQFMCKVAELAPTPLQSLVPSSEEVNARGSVDKPLFEAYGQPFTKPRALTVEKSKRKQKP